MLLRLGGLISLIVGGVGLIAGPERIGTNALLISVVLAMLGVILLFRGEIQRDLRQPRIADEDDNRT